MHRIRHPHARLDYGGHCLFIMDNPLHLPSGGFPKDFHRLERTEIHHHLAFVRLDATFMELGFQTPATIQTQG
jgi:hypothetical protein